jgi:proteasome lid subunit RPN8/RPN11
LGGVSLIEISLAIVRAIEDHARATYPEECCGFLLGSAGEPRRVVESQRARNAAPEQRTRRYVIDPLELLRADDAARARGLDLIGIYHSHPDHPAEPSEFDRSRAVGWYTYVILGIENRKPRSLTAWRFDESTHRFLPEEIVTSPEGARPEG